jgi:hypothetical protein
LLVRVAATTTIILQQPNVPPTANITAVKPDTELIVDKGMCYGEFTSMELTNDDKRTALIVPFLSYMPRKPPPIAFGCEIKGLPCCSFGFRRRTGLHNFVGTMA